MKHFMAVFTGTPEAMERSGWTRLDEAERQRRTHEGMIAWHDWMARHAGQVVVAGGPLGKTLRVSPEGIEPWHNALAGYVVVSAEDHQAAARLFERHPHFSIFPGDAVEVVECLPVPAAGTPPAS